MGRRDQGQIVLTATQTGSVPVHTTDSPGVYRVGDAIVEIHDVAESLERFAAGDSIQEHCALLILSLCRESLDEL